MLARTPALMLVLFLAASVHAQGLLVSSTWKSFAIPFNPKGRALVGDFNNDGSPDVLAADPTARRVACLMGAGSAGLQTISVTPIAPLWPLLVGVSDLDGDGNLDAVVETDSGALNLMGAGDGTFNATAVQTYPISRYGSQSSTTLHALSDLDGDGNPELILRSNVAPVSQYIIVYTNSGGAWAWATSSFLGYGPVDPTTQTLVGDFNADGLQDVLLLPTGPAPPHAGYIPTTFQAARGITAFTFSLIPGQFSMDGPGTKGVADLTGDGAADLVGLGWSGPIPVSVNAGSVTSLLQSPFFTSGLANNPSAPSLPRVFPLFGDFDGDGRTDALAMDSDVTGPWSTFSTADTTSFSLLMNRGGPLSQPIASDHGAPRIVYGLTGATGDMDGDGDPDVVVIRDIAGASVEVGVVWNRATFGPGAPGATGLPTLSLGTARPGNGQFAVALAGARPGVEIALGASLATSQFGPTSGALWLDPSPSQLVLPRAGLGITSTDATGSVSLGLPLPADPALSGTPVFVQWVVPDPASPLILGNTRYALSDAHTAYIW